MNKKRTIKKIFVLTAWIVVIIGIATLLIAANSGKRAPLCKKVLIGIRGTGDHAYIEESDVLKKLETASKGSLVNKPVQSINLSSLENLLESSSWIRDAELYIDNSGVLHVTVEEREPIARVFTTAGTSFYLDTAGVRMPLLDRLTAKVPVVTGFTNAKKWNKADSALIKEVTEVSAYIYQHPFWNAQVGQIDITADRKFELIPVIGNHLIRIGNAERIEDKLNNLYVFYRQVLSKTGFEKYEALDARYEDQIIGIRKESTSTVDSVQLQKNIEELLNKSMDTEQARQLSRSAPSSQIPLAGNNNTPVQVKPEEQANAKTAPEKTTPKPNRLEKPKKEKNSRAKPKAVMTKRN